MSTCLKHGNPTCPLCLGDFWGFPGTQAPDLLWCLLEAPSVSFQDPINSDRSRFWEPGTPINPCLPSQHSPDHFSGPDIPGTSPTLKAPPAPAAPDDFQGLKLTAHFLRVPRLTSLLLHCCNHYVRLWSFLKKIHFWVFFKWNKIIICKRYLHLPHIHCSIFTTAKKLKQSNCPLRNEWIKTPWYIMDYYPVIRVTSYLPIWMNLEDTMLSEISQRKTNISHICEI